MPHSDTIPVSASIASTGKGIRYIGEHCYAYSGVIQVTPAETTLLEFTTGAGYIRGQVQIEYLQADADDVEIIIYFNSVQVHGYYSTGGPNPAPDNSLKLIIPPFTEVKMTGDNQAGAGNRPHVAAFTGRVYGAE